MPPQEQSHKEDLSYVILSWGHDLLFSYENMLHDSLQCHWKSDCGDTEAAVRNGVLQDIVLTYGASFAANARWDKYERSIRHDYITEKQDHQRSGEMLLLVTTACMPPEEDCSRGHARQIAKTRFFNATPVQHLVEITDELWAREALNCGSSLPRSDGCHKCFALAVDYFSKRVEAGPLMFKDATAVAWFSSINCWSHVDTNVQRMEFVNAVSAQLQAKPEFGLPPRGQRTCRT